MVCSYKSSEDCAQKVRDYWQVFQVLNISPFQISVEWSGSKTSDPRSGGCKELITSVLGRIQWQTLKITYFFKYHHNPF